jgi:O-antigen biosynthesis protein
VRVLTNAANTGFVGSCNRGAAAARGRWILFLNNDTEPKPGWLEPLIALGESSPDVGAVGSKLVFGDGTLQEAGGIVFRDGSGWNFGRGDAPGRPSYRDPCEVDYISGAALMVRRDLFERLGGLDPRFAPGYYEDTDLCFGVRSLGHKVLFCPESVVVHFEGITSGTDTGSGMKRYQVLNRSKFISKWRGQLARHEPNPDVSGRRPVTADRARRLAAALVDRTSPVLRKITVS